MHNPFFSDRATYAKRLVPARMKEHRSYPLPPAPFEIFSKTPMEMRVIHKEEPPALSKGSVIPVVGIVAVTTAILIKAWTIIYEVIPTARRLP